MSELSLRSNLPEPLSVREPVTSVLPPTAREADPPAPMLSEARVCVMANTASAEPVLSVLTLTVSGPDSALIMTGAPGAVSLMLMVVMVKQNQMMMWKKHLELSKIVVMEFYDLVVMEQQELLMMDE